MALTVERGGRGEALLVLLHGLGATAAVWRPFVEAAPEGWNGAWIAPDLSGHGGSPGTAPYSVGTLAVDVARLLADLAPARMVILGHSLGGAMALALASGWFGPTPKRVFGLGIKVDWSEAELARLADLAARPVKLFDTEGEAIDRYAKVAGLDPSRSDCLDRGVVPADGGWRLAMDPAANAVGAPAMRGLVAAAQCPVHLARGEHDPLVTVDALRRFDPSARDIADAGHNAMVDAPAAIWEWLGDAIR